MKNVHSPRFRLTTLLVLIGTSFVVRAQAQAPPPAGALLIPYNDRGTWGYCDTLGKQVIEPAYEEASFFFNFRLVGERIMIAKVRTRWGDNRVFTDGELLLPKKMAYHKQFYADGKATNSFLVSKKGKYGIYDREEGFILPLRYDSIVDQYPWVLFKANQDGYYRHYDAETRALEPTRYTGVSSYFEHFNNVTVATTVDGKHFQRRDGQLLPVSEEKLANLTSEDEIYLELVDDSVIADSYRYRRKTPTSSAAALGVDRIVEELDFSALSFIEKYDFRRVILAERDGRYGILSGEGREILPFRYDRLTLTEDAMQVILEKDGKVGRKLLFTIHPTIEPRYDKLEEYTRLRVNDYWSFAVYKVELNGKTGYVGENGVEYFRW